AQMAFPFPAAGSFFEKSIIHKRLYWQKAQKATSSNRRLANASSDSLKAKHAATPSGNAPAQVFRPDFCRLSSFLPE
ncbi:MAG TPA: hypothetical protein H9998_02570, partial [Candidatus Ruthenibacterium merdipullorum]|nr:hypothetical protein [Candidatus Ruthenibacterium merdipullorum]